MIKILQNQLAEKLLLTKLFLAKQKTQSKNFLEEMSIVKKILVIMPADSRSEGAHDFLQKLNQIFDQAQISTFEISSLRKSDINWLGVPNKTFLLKIQEEKFDLLIDINQRPDKICTYLGALSNAAIRTHISDNKYDKIYNLHIRSDIEAPLVTRYDTLLNYLKKLHQKSSVN